MNPLFFPSRYYPSEVGYTADFGKNFPSCFFGTYERKLRFVAPFLFWDCGALPC
jgi:hypothetical protein